MDVGDDGVVEDTDIDEEGVGGVDEADDGRAIGGAFGAALPGLVGADGEGRGVVPSGVGAVEGRGLEAGGDAQAGDGVEAGEGGELVLGAEGGDQEVDVGHGVVGWVDEDGEAEAAGGVGGPGSGADAGGPTGGRLDFPAVGSGAEEGGGDFQFEGVFLAGDDGEVDGEDGGEVADLVAGGPEAELGDGGSGDEGEVDGRGYGGEGDRGGVGVGVG